MPLPADLTTIVVTGAFPAGGGAPLQGAVSFTPSADLTDSVGHAVIRAAPVEASLDYTGSISQVLVCTDNPDLSPSGWTWTVTERIVGLAVRTYSVLLPHTRGPSVDLSELVQVTPVTPPAGALLSQNNLADVASAPASRTNLGLGTVALLSAPGGATEFLRADGTWDVPAGGGGGVQIGGDLGGTDSAPLVISTSLTDPLPLAQGGTNAADAPGARTALGLGTAATQASGAFDAAGAAAAALAAAEANAASTYLPLTGGALSGPLAMGAHKVTGVANGTVSTDGAALGQVPTVGAAGSGAGNALSANDAATTNARTPTVHASTHASGGTDPVTPAAIGALAAANNLSDLSSAPTARTSLGLGAAATAGLPLSIGNGGTGQITAQSALNALTGTQTAGRYLRSDGANAALAAIAPGDVPTLNQSTTGTAAGLSATLAVGSGGTGQTGAAAAYNALSPMSTLGDLEYESGANTAARLPGNTGAAKAFLTQTGTGTISAAPAWAAIAAADVPTLNQNTTGTAGNVTGTVAVANGGTGATSAANARSNLGLGTQAQQNFGTLTGALAEVLPPYACAVSGGSQLTAAVLILNLVRPGPILATSLGIWLSLAGVTSSGANGLALYTEAGVLIDQTGDMSAAFAGVGYVEAALGAQQQLAANTSYYLAALSHFSGTAPKAASAVAGQAIPVVRGHYLSLTKSATATFPPSFTPSALTTSTAAYYMAMT